MAFATYKKGQQMLWKLLLSTFTYSKNKYLCRESTYLHIMYCLVYYNLEGLLQKKRKENIINIGKTGHNDIWVMEIRLFFHQNSYSRNSNILKFLFSLDSTFFNTYVQPLYFNFYTSTYIHGFFELLSCLWENVVCQD